MRPVRARIRLDGIDDATLARAAAQGDQKAFAALVDRHRPGVTHLATRFCQEPAGVEDLAQEIFVKAYLNLGGLRDWAMFRSWLHRIAANTCIDWLRRRKAEVGLVGGLDESLPDEGELARGQAREAQRRLEAAMAVLGPKDRLLVALLGLEGKSVEEVAQLTGLSQVNVKVRAFRARRKLKAFLEKDHG
ncbi:RNA polymerase, sigma-24 subunit, ECF subfamily [Desulfovibrio sp. TomC]|nr:RNA polymerase, sigma-24 subunit, ECF subfamily [Desulfovibrio sp. TomC]